MNDSPDYQSYSLEQLYDVLSHINREKHPDRFASLVQEIARKEQMPANKPSLSRSPASVGNALTGFIYGGTLGLVSGVALGFVIMVLLIETGPVSARTNLDGATGLGSIVFFAAFVGSVIGAIKGLHHALK